MLELRSVRLPSEVTGSVGTDTPGRIRFVASALDGVGEPPLVVLRFQRRAYFTSSSLGVAFEEVTASGDLEDLTSLIAGGRPLFLMLP